MYGGEPKKATIKVNVIMLPAKQKFLAKICLM